MKNKTAPIIVGILIIVIIIGAAIIILNYSKEDGGNGGNIGGQEDEHGCLTGAGYSWNESVGACVREWELKAEDRRAAEIAIAPLSFPVTVVEVSKQECEGCYNITLQRNDNQERMEVNLRNWAIAIENNVDGKKNYCSPAQRGAQMCTMEYAPVCGWFNENIKCVKYPCAQTYSNPCMACSNENVAYWTDGECPK